MFKTAESCNTSSFSSPKKWQPVDLALSTQRKKTVNSISKATCLAGSCRLKLRENHYNRELPRSLHSNEERPISSLIQVSSRRQVTRKEEKKKGSSEKLKRANPRSPASRLPSVRKGEDGREVSRQETFKRWTQWINIDRTYASSAPAPFR